MAVDEGENDDIAGFGMLERLIEPGMHHDGGVRCGIRESVEIQIGREVDE